MRQRSKRYRQAREKVDASKTYSLEEAIALLKQLETTRFDETVEVSVHLGIDSRKSDQFVRGSVALPKGLGKTRKVIVFAEGNQAESAREAGADEVGSDELIKKIQEGWLDFDVAIAQPAMMRHVGKLGRILGPQGKMPSPKTGTVTDDVGTVVQEFKAGKVEYRNDSGGNVHAPIGKLSFPAEDLQANLEAFLAQIKASRPSAAKGTFMQRAVLSSCMSPGIPIAIA